MEGPCTPQHRVITPPPPALVPSKNVGRLRALFTSSSSHDHPEMVPQRKRSVHFQAHNDGLLDEQPEERSENTSEHDSRRSHRSSLSQRLSDHLESLGAKLNGANGTQTIVHRKGSRQRHTQPYINPIDTMSGKAVGSWNTIPSTNSSFTPTKHNMDWSPVSTASTAATSLTSPGSSGPWLRNRQSPEECHNLSKSVSAGVDEGFLPPIQEDSGRLLVIPVQEEPVEALPSVVTVENVAAAKVYFETHFHKVLMEPNSPRSIRLKKLEQRMADLGFAHDQRVEARRQWNQAESDHLRQIRVLKSTSHTRHHVKGVSIAGFDVIRVLGKGSFGVVRLVTERSGISSTVTNRNDKDLDGETPLSNVDGTAKHNLPTGKPLSDVFAMKVIRKSEMLRACQEGHLRAERDFLVGAEDSRWVVPLIASFQDNTNLYLVMEYMIGGDFLGLLLREDVLDEQVAR